MTSPIDDIASYALKRGAMIAKIISPRDLIIEERVVFKCLNCPDYNNNWSCPPHTPPVSAFKKMIREYKYALVMVFKSSMNPSLLSDYEEMKKIWGRDKKKAFNISLDVERYAFNKGFPFAYLFRPGSCNICPKCDMSKGCRHQLLLRYPLCAAGINIVKTLKKIGVSLSFPPKNPLLVSILLID